MAIDYSCSKLVSVILVAVVTGPLAGQSGGEGTVIVTNMSDNTATVVDVKSRSVRATVTTGIGPHEVAASSDGKWAVVSNYGNRTTVGNSLTVIDLVTARVARTIDLGEYRRPHGIKFFPGDTMLAVTSEASKAVLLVDLRTDKVVATVSTARPVSHMLALSAAGDLLYTTNIVDGSITGIDLKRRVTLATSPIARMVEGLTITPDGQQVWVGSNQDSIVVVFDTKAGRAIDSLTGFGMPYRLGITPNGKTAVISDPAKGQVRIVDVASRKDRWVVSIPGEGVVATSEFPGSSSPEGVAVSGGRLAFVTLQGQNQVAAIDLETGKLVWRAPVGTWPDGIAYAK